MTEMALTDPELAEIERVAVDLASLGGARIVAALGRTLAVRYKSPDNETSDTFRDPVSEVDQEVEMLIRERVGERFPDHDILGEESDARPARGHDVVWAVDPIDGTTNFVNGFPIFASSVGVLWRGRPIAGAVWCSTSHALRPGVYHARQGGRLRFENEEIALDGNPAVRRRLVGLGSLAQDTLPWDVRKTGSAAVECAFVAAGLLRVARFDRPNVWDVAGGVPLVLAGGGSAAALDPGGWRDFEGFLENGAEDVSDWRRAMILGAPEAVRSLREASV
jgi:myo-inositol-1(or 4)-monophosphatase